MWKSSCEDDIALLPAVLTKAQDVDIKELGTGLTVKWEMSEFV